MKKILLLLMLVASPLFLRAQPPDTEAIERMIHDSGSIYYYPNLLSRYRAGDPDLKLEDYRYLYYGYIFQPEFEPMNTPPEMDSVMMIFEKTGDPGREDLQRLIAFGNKVLEKEPFNPRMLNIMTFAYGQLGDAEKEVEYFYKFNMVIEAIRSSGDGLTEETPFYVNYFTHTQDLMDFFEFPYRKRTVISRYGEYVQLLARQGRVRGYYFDFSGVYHDYVPAARGRRSSGWQINTVPVGRNRRSAD